MGILFLKIKVSFTVHKVNCLARFIVLFWFLNPGLKN